MVNPASSPENNYRLKDVVSRLPHSPGVYIYSDKKGEIIYIGKAADLKTRVSQYFHRDDAVGQKTGLLVPQIAKITYIETVSEFDAMLLEARLIYMHQPKYNVIAKDDKSPVYVKISLSEALPHIEFIRKPRFESVTGSSDGVVVFGPFQSTRLLRSLMRSIRRVIPYCTQKKRDGKPCFYTHIGLCRPCPSEISELSDRELRKTLTDEYRKNIFRIRDILSGKSKNVLDQMEKEMNQMAAAERFEEAEAIRNQMQALYDLVTRRSDPMMYIKDNISVSNIAEGELSSLHDKLSPFFPGLGRLRRIECIDISTILGEYATGSLVVLSEGRSDTSAYRRFKIRTVKFQNDFAMIAEVTRRRFRHPEWGMPDLFVVDGGKGQVSQAKRVILESGLSIPVIGLAKRMEEIIVPEGTGFRTLRLSLTDPAVHILQRIRDEAHRFAVRYHRLLRSKDLKLDTIS